LNQNVNNLIWMNLIKNYQKVNVNIYKGVVFNIWIIIIVDLKDKY